MARVRQTHAVPAPRGSGGHMGLHARFGPQLVLRIDQALGAADEVLAAHRLPAELTAEWQLEHPTERRDLIDIILRQLLPQLTEPLARRRHGVRELECRLECQAEEPCRVSATRETSSGT